MNWMFFSTAFAETSPVSQNGQTEGGVPPVSAPELPPTVGPSSVATPVATTPVAVRTHGADRISDGTFWAGHFVGASLVIVSIVLIFAAKGPRRLDSLLAAARESDQSKSGRESQTDSDSHQSSSQ